MGRGGGSLQSVESRAHDMLVTLAAIKACRDSELVGPEATSARMDSGAVIRESDALGFLQFRALVVGEPRSEPANAGFEESRHVWRAAVRRAQSSRRDLTYVSSPTSAREAPMVTHPAGCRSILSSSLEQRVPRLTGATMRCRRYRYRLPGQEVMQLRVDSSLASALVACRVLEGKVSDACDRARGEFCRWRWTYGIPVAVECVAAECLRSLRGSCEQFRVSAREAIVLLEDWWARIAGPHSPAARNAGREATHIRLDEPGMLPSMRFRGCEAQNREAYMRHAVDSNLHLLAKADAVIAVVRSLEYFVLLCESATAVLKQMAAVAMERSDPGQPVLPAFLAEVGTNAADLDHAEYLRCCLSFLLQRWLHHLQQEEKIAS